MSKPRAKTRPRGTKSTALLQIAVSQRMKDYAMLKAIEATRERGKFVSVSEWARKKLFPRDWGSEFQWLKTNGGGDNGS